MEVDAKSMDTGNNSQEIRDGFHLSRFRAAVDQCIDKCLKLDMKVFARHYNPVWKSNKEALEALIQQVISQAKDKLREKLESAFINEDIPNLLSLMDEILKESNRTESSKVAWRPSGDPEADSRAYFMALKKRKLQELEAELHKTRHEEIILQQEVQKKRGKLSATETEIKRMVEKGKATVDKLIEFQSKNDSHFTSLNMKTEPTTNMAT